MTEKVDMTFVGRNIRALRRRKGWTLAELAERIGIREAPLGRIERGLSSPSARVVYNLGNELDVPVDAIFAKDYNELQQYRDLHSERPCFTSMGRAELPEKVAEKANKLIDCFLALEDLCGARKHASIPFQLFFYKTEEGVEDLAVSVRRFLGIENSIVFDYFELLESFGFRVLTVDFLEDLQSCSYFDVKNRNAFFFINGKFNMERQLFSLAYELGMVYMWENSLLSNVEDEFCGDDVHKAACKFAAFFLMPKDSVLKTVTQLGIGADDWTYELLLRIKQRFGVSAESFLYRLRELKLISETAYRLIKNKILAYYDANEHKEPGRELRGILPNGRLWDLVVSAQAKEGSRTEVTEIVEILRKLKVRNS